MNLIEYQDNVDEFMSKPENSGGVDKVLRSLDEQHAKYKHMELSLATKRRRLRQQIPDLARSLEMIEKLKIQKEEMETQFLLSDQVFVKVISFLKYSYISLLPNGTCITHNYTFENLTIHVIMNCQILECVISHHNAMHV